MDVSELTHRRLFDALDTDNNGHIWTWELLSKLGQTGIQPSDQRVRAALADLRDPTGKPLGLDSQPIQIDFQKFRGIVPHGDGVIQRALEGNLAVSASEYMDFVRGIQEIHDGLLDDRSGAVADYIPTLRDADPEKFGIAICTADGQTYSIGDATDPFSVQSTSKVINYGMALQELGPDEVHRWVGQEQSGGVFNDPVLSLDGDRMPRNPMINAGAIATLALVEADLPESARFRAVRETWSAMMGQRPGSDTETFYAERATGDGNRRLAREMAGGEKLRAGSDDIAIEKAAEFYFQVCSLELDAMRLAAAGATLANGGRAPYSGERVFSGDTTARVLSVMGHSGMYDASGKFAVDVGLPAKSGVSGNVMMVVPEKQLAVVVFSPRLDAAGNSVRGVKVCEQLVDRFGLHPYKGLGADRGRGVQSGADRSADTAAAIRQSLVGTGGGSRVAVVTNPVEAAGKAGRRIGKEGGGNQL